MGYYIQVPENKNKAQQLVDIHGAVILPQHPEAFEDTEGQALICVVDNGPFEAAAFCYSRDEFIVFTRPDSGIQRPRTWVLMDQDLAHQLSGFDGGSYEARVN